MQEEWKDLKDQWEFSQPEKAEALKKQGEDLDKLAQTKLENAEENQQSNEQIIAERLNENVTDPEKRKQNEELARMMALEMKNEELKYL